MPEILPIITMPDPQLRKRSRALNIAELKAADFAALCRDMAATMVKKDGIGLAAPQIGRNIRLIVINSKNGAFFLVNPKLDKKSWRKEWGEEGCLSVPGVFGQVKRHKSLVCRYLDESGAKKTISAAGLLARVLQHEVDHLDGILSSISRRI
jgi:peptide deformylase